MTFKNKLIIYDNDETLAKTSGIINGIFIEGTSKNGLCSANFL